jgi:hypothetical protein
MSTEHKGSPNPINPKGVRYIKLGEAGRWEEECLAKGIVRFGFGSATAERFPICLARRWHDLKQSFLAAGKGKGTATKFTNETRLFFEDEGSTLWITFMQGRLSWGFLTSDPPQCHPDGDGVYRTVDGGWKQEDIKGGLLAMDSLAGHLTQLAAYRGTSCSVDSAEYVIRRINGDCVQEVVEALRAMAAMKSAVIGMMRQLKDKDFELLVDLVFTASGWRRLGKVGGPQKLIDIALELPSTGEWAFAQVKSKTNSRELADYVADIPDHFRRMFFVFHTGRAETDDDRVTVIGPEKLADMVVDAGLVNWLIRKVS